MRRMIILTIALVLTVFSGVAAPYTYDMGPDSYVDTSGTNSALEMWAIVNPNLNDILFDLDVGESYSFYFALIGTNETWINGDDLNPGTLYAYVDFDNPDITQSIEGTSDGYIWGWLGFNQAWTLVWNDPLVVNFGTGGQFTIDLSDAYYSSGFWQGPDGSDGVWATVTHNATPTSSSTSVPEPGTLLLLGAGLIGLVGISRRMKQ